MLKITVKGYKKDSRAFDIWKDENTIGLLLEHGFYPVNQISHYDLRAHNCNTGSSVNTLLRNLGRYFIHGPIMLILKIRDSTKQKNSVSLKFVKEAQSGRAYEYLNGRYHDGSNYIGSPLKMFFNYLNRKQNI